MNIRILILLFFIFNISTPIFSNDLQVRLQKKQIEEICNRLPKKAEDIEIFVNETLKKAEALIQRIQSLSEKESSFAAVIGRWSEAEKEYFSSFALLYGMEMISQDSQLIESSKLGCLKLLAALKANLSEEVIEKILSFIEKSLENKEADLFQKYYFNFFLDVKQEGFFKNLDRVAKIKEDLEKNPGQPFICVHQLDSKEKKGSHTFSVLNWNVCFLPGFLSLTLGGVVPWEYRLEKVADFIKKSEADVLCLQEVFDEKAAFSLHEALKSEYSYFYFNIDPSSFGFDSENMSLGSGLFVASKFKISNPKWTKFHDTWLENVKRGFFEFDIIDKQKVAHIITTHLDPSLALGSAENFRLLQLKQILGQLEKDHLYEARGPVIICGDLNVCWGCNEPSEILLKKYFDDPHAKEEGLGSATYCDFTGFWWPEYVLNEKNTFIPKPGILDYSLVLKKKHSSFMTHANFVHQAKILQANFAENPGGALSDHHGLLTTFFWDAHTTSLESK